ncbi:MAG: hypothetical protein IJH09_00965 [Clostridia bacterium]|nr:hypothetical protein [Clostridia bacterium]
MRNTSNCTRGMLRRLSLVLALCLMATPVLAEGLASDLGGGFVADSGDANGLASDLGGLTPDAGAAPADPNGLASDLGGGFQAAAPQQSENYTPVDMTSADVIIGYVDPSYSALSPTLCSDWGSVSVNQLVFESVVDLDENMKPVPMLADNWVQDGRIWTFNLRSGIQFHNGYELTAYDVVRSYQTIISTGASNPYYARLQMLNTMEATDIYVLTVDAKTTSMLALYAMNFPVMQYETLYDELPRGTGPYWYIQRDGDGTTRLEANPLWWKQQPGVKSILLKRFDTAGDAIEAIYTNRIDMLTTISPKASLSRKLANFASMDYPTLTYELLIPNLGEGSLMSDINLRQAVMFAIDRSVVASNGYADMAIQCEVPVLPTCWLYESQSAIYYYSPERALQLLNNSGWFDLTGDGTLNKREGIMLIEPTVSIITYNEGSNSIRENAANLIAEYLNAVGFNASVTVKSNKTAVQEAIKDREYDLALVGMNLSETPDISPLLSSRGNLNLNHYSNEAMDQLLDRASQASDETLLKKVYSDIQMTVVQRLPLLGLLFRTGTVLSSRPIGGMGALRAYDNFNGFEFLSE